LLWLPLFCRTHLWGFKHQDAISHKGRREGKGGRERKKGEATSFYFLKVTTGTAGAGEARLGVTLVRNT
jgi:hypothetical protein